MTEALRVCVVVGVGAGLGAALGRRFAAGYRVALVARSREYLDGLAAEIGPHATSVPADVGSAAEIRAAFETIRAKLGSPEVLIYNTGIFPFGGFDDITAEQFEAAWRVNALGAFLCSKEVVPDMLARNRGVILFTGATAGVKAGARSVAFGPAKFALRGLAQSMARDLGPKGVHVASINIDGAIDMPRVRSLIPQLRDEDCLKPSAIAETYWHLAHQDPSAWTMETEVRPFREKF